LGTIMGAVEQIEAEMGRRQEKSEAKSQEPKAKTEDGRGHPQITQIPQIPEIPTGTLEPLNPRTPLSDEKVRKYIGYVKDEVTRLKKMTDAFMRFTKLNPPALQPRNVNELVRKVVAKYEGALAKGISLELNLDDGLPLVALDEDGITNVLDIVVENAVEAMAAVGSRQNTVDRALRIRTSAESAGSRQNDANGAQGSGTGSRSDLGELGGLGGSLVRIEVTDNGAGIPEKYLDKVFEPYFTRGKPDGTGLGLALAKKIVEDHGGRIEIRSTEGVGTTVAIVLSVASK